MIGCEPVEPAQFQRARAQGLAGTDDDFVAVGVDLDDIQWVSGRNFQAAALAYGVIDNAFVAAEFAPIDVDNLAGMARAGLQTLNHVAVFAGGHEADVLAVGLFGIHQAEFMSQLADFRLGHAAEGKPQLLQLFAGGCKQEIALVARCIDRAAQLGTVGAVGALDIMARRERGGPKILGGFQQIGELDLAVAGHARDRRFASDIAIGESIDDLVLEALFIVQNVMGDAKGFGDAACVVDVLACAAAAFAASRAAVVI